MFRKLSPYLLVVALVLGLLAFQWQPTWLWMISLALTAVFLIVIKSISRKNFFGQWYIWLTYLIFLYSCLGQFAIINSAAFRVWYLLLITLVWLWLVYSSSVYFSAGRDWRAQQYLEVDRFVDYLAIWQALNVLYFSLLFINLADWLAVFIVGLAVLIIINNLISVPGLKKSSKSLVLSSTVLTTVQIFFFLSLLPLHFYIQSTLVSLWLFFIMELTLKGQEIKSRKRLFWAYFIAIVTLLLAILLGSNI